LRGVNFMSRQTSNLQLIDNCLTDAKFGSDFLRTRPLIRAFQSVHRCHHEWRSHFCPFRLPSPASQLDYLSCRTLQCMRSGRRRTGSVPRTESPHVVGRADMSLPAATIAQDPTRCEEATWRRRAMARQLRERMALGRRGTSQDVLHGLVGLLEA
jgi:hypothetical protein